ncbi:amidase [Sphaerisporangium corydalis]|uniref:Amidase n=1 Tax=Sphaerisporangium corydalis TaxID=1441875 RepID=A0ABV9E8N7_9ACTN|nr:amidase [Sphaerisporangium corydalis]
MDDLTRFTATELAHLIRRRALSPVELVESSLTRIEKRDQVLNAFVTVCADQAMDAARAAERAVTSGEVLGPLHGLPVAIKDLDAVAGVRMTLGSRLFADHVPDRDAAFVTRLKRAGAIVVGKTSTSEFGHKAVADNPLTGPARNPFDHTMNTGGSSGGSAAAVAEGLVPLAQGSDGGGSIRVPASMCGVVGMMGTFGRVAEPARPNAFGLLTPSVFFCPLGRTVEDAALMLEVMSGPDPRDPYSLPVTAGGPRDGLTRSLRGLRVAYSPDFGGFPVEEEVAAAVRGAIPALAEDGAVVEEVRIRLPASHQELTAMWRRLTAVRQAEFAHHALSRGLDLLGEHRELISPDYVDTIRLGAAQSAVDYRVDDALRTELFDAVADVFDTYDLIVSPVTSVAGVPNGANGDTLGPSEVCGQAVDPLVGWCLTYALNLTGNPAASVPAGWTRSGLPVGMQIAGRRFGEPSVVAACAAVERRRPWYDRYRALGS